MASARATEAYGNLVIEFLQESGVTESGSGLAVHGRVFAFLEANDLVIELPLPRATDLVRRGQAERFSTPSHPSRDWVRVNDLQLWPELTREAHEFVGEPPVGDDS
jgi:hypothetical protein